MIGFLDLENVLDYNLNQTTPILPETRQTLDFKWFVIQQLKQGSTQPQVAKKYNVPLGSLKRWASQLKGFETLEEARLAKQSKRQVKAFSEQEREAILQELNNGLFTQEELAKKHQISPDTLYKWKKQKQSLPAKAQTVVELI